MSGIRTTNAGIWGKPAPAVALVKRELLTSMRRGRTYALMALVVAGAILLAAWGWPEGQRALTQAASFSRAFMGFFVSVVTLAAIFFVPAFAANSVTLEREQGTFDLLRMTLVRPSGIIAAKLVNSVGLFLLVIIAGFPVLGAAFFLVGLDWGQVAQTMLVTLGGATMYGLIGIAVSARAKSGPRAIAASYGLVIVLVWLGPSFVARIPLALGWPRALLAGLSPFVALIAVQVGKLDWWEFGVGLFIQAGIAALLFLIALRALRRAAEPKKVETRKPIDDPKLVWRRRLRFPFYIIDPLKRKKPIKDGRNPAAVKEFRWGLARQGTMPARMFCAGLVVFFPVVVGAVGTESYRPLLVAQLVGTLLIGPALVAGSLTRERELGNLDMLRLTLLRPREIVLGKLTAGLVSVSPVALAGLAWTPVCLPWARAEHWTLFVTAYGTLIVSVWLCLVLSLLASLLVRRTATALALSYMFSFLAFVGGAWIVRYLGASILWRAARFRWPDSLDSATAFLSPALAFGETLSSVSRHGPHHFVTVYWLANVAMFAVLAALLTWLAVGLFARRHMRDR